jgi:dolichyl-phosphate-mannose--protein O-mannosyl transferase
MLTFRALMRMKPWPPDFDPRLYQYGGGYIYLVGAALSVAGVTGIIPLKAEAGFYLEHPDTFARVYVVARCISLMFGALTLVAVYRLGRRAGGRSAGWLALVCVAGAPVFRVVSEPGHIRRRD